MKVSRLISSPGGIARPISYQLSSATCFHTSWTMYVSYTVYLMSLLPLPLIFSVLKLI